MSIDNGHPPVAGFGSFRVENAYVVSGPLCWILSGLQRATPEFPLDTNLQKDPAQLFGWLQVPDRPLEYGHGAVRQILNGAVQGVLVGDGGSCRRRTCRGSRWGACGGRRGRASRRCGWNRWSWCPGGSIRRCDGGSLGGNHSRDGGRDMLWCGAPSGGGRH